MLPYLVLALGGAAIAFAAYTVTGAMVWGGGRAIIDFNRYHEGWLESGLLIGAVILYPWAWWTCVKQSK